MQSVSVEQEKNATLKLVEEFWESWYVNGISDFVRVPNLTPMVDENYSTNGLLKQAIDLIQKYVEKL